jgi:REP element-mobilizing transposase RayT
MPRRKRVDEAGGVYHALNRGNARQTIFHKDEDYEAFLRTLAEGLERYPVELFSFCLMRNRWHLVLRPLEDGQMGRMLRWVTHLAGHLRPWCSRPSCRRHPPQATDRVTATHRSTHINGRLRGSVFLCAKENGHRMFRTLRVNRPTLMGNVRARATRSRRKWLQF